MLKLQGFVNSLNHGPTTSDCYSSQINSQNISCSSVKLSTETQKLSQINIVDSNLLPISVKQEFSCYPSPPASLNHAEGDLSEQSFDSGTGSLSISKKFCCQCLKDAIGYIDRSGRLIMNSCTCTKKEMSLLEASQSDDYLFQRLEEERRLYAKCNSRRTVAALPHSESSSPHSLSATLANATIVPTHQHHLMMSWTNSSNDSSGFSSPMSHSTCAFSDADTLCGKEKAEDHYKSRSSSVSSLPDENSFLVPTPPLDSVTEFQNFTRTPTTHFRDSFSEDLENQNEESTTLGIDCNNLHSTASLGVSESIFYSSSYFRAQVNEAKLPPNDERVKLVIQVIGSTVQAHMETCVYTSEKVSLGYQKYKELMSDKPEVSFLNF